MSWVLIFGVFFSGGSIFVLNHLYSFCRFFTGNQKHTLKTSNFEEAAF